MTPSVRRLPMNRIAFYQFPVVGTPKICTDPSEGAIAGRSCMMQTPAVPYQHTLNRESRFVAPVLSRHERLRSAIGAGRLVTFAAFGAIAVGLAGGTLLAGALVLAAIMQPLGCSSGFRGTARHFILLHNCSVDMIRRQAGDGLSILSVYRSADLTGCMGLIFRISIQTFLTCQPVAGPHAVSGERRAGSRVDESTPRPGYDPQISPLIERSVK